MTNKNYPNRRGKSAPKKVVESEASASNSAGVIDAAKWREVQTDLDAFSAEDLERISSAGFQYLGGSLAGTVASFREQYKLGNWKKPIFEIFKVSRNNVTLNLVNFSDKTIALPITTAKGGCEELEISWSIPAKFGTFTEPSNRFEIFLAGDYVEIPAGTTLSIHLESKALPMKNILKGRQCVVLHYELDGAEEQVRPLVVFK